MVGSDVHPRSFPLKKWWPIEDDFRLPFLRDLVGNFSGAFPVKTSGGYPVSQAQGRAIKNGGWFLDGPIYNPVIGVILVSIFMGFSIKSTLGCVLERIAFHEDFGTFIGSKNTLIVR